MMQSTQSGVAASWDSDTRVDRAVPIESAAADNNVKVPTDSRDAAGTTLMKSDEPANVSGDGGAAAAAMPANDLDDFEYVPTPCSPRRIDRCRWDNFVLLFMLLLTFVFGVVALASPIVFYRSSSVRMDVTSLYVDGTTVDGGHQRYKTHALFCDSFTEKSDGFTALFIMAILVCSLGFALALCPVICGRVLLCSYLVHSLLAVCWFFVMVALILSAQMYTAKLCHSTSLKSIGFRYGPAFGVTAALFAFLSVTLIFLVVYTCVRPPKFRY